MIKLKYGYITGLTPVLREQSPEGTQDHNLLAVATTDDTHWKFAMIKYLTKHRDKWNGENFTDFIVEFCASLTRSLYYGTEIPNPDFLATQIEKNRLDKGMGTSGDCLSKQQ